MEAADWPAVEAIYLAGISTNMATFETAAPSCVDWDGRHLRTPRLVAIADGDIAGWAALSPVSSRKVYAGVAEVSVYVAAAARGLGVGTALLRKLIADAEANGVWTLQASIFPENLASIALHTACGFREVGRRERIGQMHGVWRDTILFERRSPKIGDD